MTTLDYVRFTTVPYRWLLDLIREKRVEPSCNRLRILLTTSVGDKLLVATVKDTTSYINTSALFWIELSEIW